MGLKIKTLQNLIKEKGFDTIDEFFLFINVAPATYYRIVRGDSEPRVATLKKIADGLGVKHTDIYDYEDTNQFSVSEPKTNYKKNASVSNKMYDDLKEELEFLKEQISLKDGQINFLQNEIMSNRNSGGCNQSTGS